MPRSKSSKMSENVVTAAGGRTIDSWSGEDLGAEALSIRQRNAARLLAVGYSQQQTADAVGVAVRTVQRWSDDATFSEIVQEMHVTAWTRVEHAVMATLEHAIDVQQAMLRGEIKPDDKRYIEAARLIDRLLTRLFAIDAPSIAHAAPTDGETGSASDRLSA